MNKVSMYFTENSVTTHKIWKGVKFSLANFPECISYISIWLTHVKIEISHVGTYQLILGSR